MANLAKSHCICGGGTVLPATWGTFGSAHLGAWRHASRGEGQEEKTAPSSLSLSLFTCPNTFPTYPSFGGLHACMHAFLIPAETLCHAMTFTLCHGQ